MVEYLSVRIWYGASYIISDNTILNESKRYRLQKMIDKTASHPIFDEIEICHKLNSKDFKKSSVCVITKLNFFCKSNIPHKLDWVHSQMSHFSDIYKIQIFFHKQITTIDSQTWNNILFLDPRSLFSYITISSEFLSKYEKELLKTANNEINLRQDAIKIKFNVPGIFNNSIMMGRINFDNNFEKCIEYFCKNHLPKSSFLEHS